MKRWEQLRRWPGLELKPHSRALQKCLPLDSEEFFWGILKPQSYFIEELFYLSDPSHLEAKPGEMEWGKQALGAGLCLLLRGTDYLRWGQLENREFESFLREQNHLPAFKQYPWLEKMAEEMLENVKKNLLTSHFKLNWERVQSSLSPPFSVIWCDSPPKRVEMALHLQNAIFYPFCKQFALAWELFALEGETFVFKGEAPRAWELSALGEFIRCLFKRESLNIVAQT